MITQSIQSDPAISFEQLEHLSDKSSRETKRALQNKATQQHLKVENALDTQIDKLEDQQKNSLRAALFGLFMKMAAAAANFIPFAGPFISTILSTVAETLNPFRMKAEDSKLDALESNKEAEVAKGRSERLKGQADEIEKTREVERQRLDKALANLATSQTAAVRI